MKSVLTLFCIIVITVNVSQSQWAPSNNGLGDQSVGALFADGDTLYAGTITGIYKSTNSGASWFLSSNGLTPVTNFFSIVRSGNYLVAGGDAAGVWRSSDNGASWAKTTNGVLTNEYAYTLLADGNTVYGAFGFPSSVGISTDNGATWTKYTNGISSTYTMTGALNKAGTLFAAHGILGVLRSTNNGANWEPANSGITAVYKNALLLSGTNLVVGGTNGLYFSSDNGDSWNHQTTGVAVYGMSKIGSALYAVGQAIHKSTDDGQTWSAIDLTGIPGSIQNTLQIAGNYAFINFFGIGVYRRPVSEVTTDVAGAHELPMSMELSQNYPNPFNPTTTIRYSLPAGQAGVSRLGYVSLKVFNILGEEIQTLVNEKVEAGEHRITFNAEGLPGGVYIYRIQSGSFTDSHKMLLLK